jgi:hypothetical protein
VRVRPEWDETLQLLGQRTRPGTVTSIHGSPVAHVPTEAVVCLDDGQAVPYLVRHLDRLDSGVDLIAAERRRQVVEEGYPTAHDLDHETDGELVIAAWCYLGDLTVQGDDYTTAEHFDEPDAWPWPSIDGAGPIHGCSWKPTPDDDVRQLVKAGALIAAEIDRLVAGRGHA